MHHLNHGHCYGEHFLGRLDPRVKLLSTLVLLVMVISSRTYWFPLITAGLAAGVIFGLGVPLRVLAHRFLEPFVIILLVICMKLFLSGNQQLFSLEFAGVGIIGYGDGLQEGLRIASRIAGAVTLVTAVGFATPFTELMAALAWLRVPKGLIEVALFAWRYLFVLLDDATVLYNAQRNRLGYAGCRRSFRSLGTLAGALVIKAFDNSQAITTAMHQRGYDGTMPLMRHKPFKGGEVVGAVAILVFSGLLWQVTF